MKRVLVIGMARSGLPVARLLHEKGNFVILNDRKSEEAELRVLDGLRLENVSSPGRGRANCCWTAWTWW